MRGTKSAASVTSGKRSIQGVAPARDIFFHEDYVVLNQQKVPQNVMERMEK